MVRQSPRSAKKTNTPVGSLANNDLNGQVSHHNRNQKTSPEGKITKSSTCKAGVKNGRKRVKSEADGGSENTSLEKRVSARIQTKQIEKELLVRRRVELLDNQEIGSNVKKTRTRRSNDVDAASEAVGGSEIMSHGVVGENSIVGNGCTTNLAEKSDHAKAKETLRLFNKHYLHFIQVEEMRCRNSEAERKASKGSKSKNKTPVEATKIPVKRPDLKAISKMIQLKEVLYPKKRIGNIPGIVVGHQFYSRAEMVVVGFHSHWLNGIDYMGSSYSKLYSNYTFPIAVAIVLSGMYEDDLDNADDVVYTGQGGHNLTGNKRQIRDQVLERGNLALKNCVEQCVPVRVVRGHGSTSSYCGKVYTYDGLYKVVQYWAEKGISGFTIFKYRLRRLEGQPLLTTNQVHFTCGRAPQSVSEIRGLVCEDITGGQEDVPIPATNMVDDPAVAPIGFTYCKSIRVAQNVKLPMTVNGCSCEGTCMDPKTCSCAMLNGPDFPYVHRDGGRLIEARDVVFECGPKCGCGPGCVNRTSQRGLRYRLEVYRTPKKGWAVRCWDFIPSGAPVCEYTGIIKRTEDMDHIHENNYIFDIDCLQTMRGLDGRERRSKDASLQAISSSDRADLRPESVPEFCIDAGSTGNIARFINHSCEPNLFVQCVLSSHSDMRLARVMLFAADNIPPMQELTYDYGYVIDSVYGTDGKIKQMPCFCGAADCRKRLF